MSSPASDYEDGPPHIGRTIHRVRLGQIFPKPILSSDTPLAGLRQEISKDATTSIYSRALPFLGLLFLLSLLFYFSDASSLEPSAGLALGEATRALAASPSQHAASMAASTAGSPALPAAAAAAVAATDSSALPALAAEAEEGEGKLRGKRSGPPVAALLPEQPVEDAAAALVRMKALEEEARKKVETDKAVHASEAQRAAEDKERESREQAAQEEKDRLAKAAEEAAKQSSAGASGEAAAAAEEEGEEEGEEESTDDPEEEEGPLVVQQALRDKCFTHVGKDANGHKNTYTFCAYSNVQQHVVEEAVTFKVGSYQGWALAKEQAPASSKAGKPAATLYSAQLYEGGDSCGPTISRATVVVFHCDSAMTTPTLIKAAEVSVCKYRLDMSLAEWCEVEEKGLAGKYEGE